MDGDFIEPRTAPTSGDAAHHAAHHAAHRTAQDAPHPAPSPAPTPRPDEDERRRLMHAAGVPEELFDHMGPHGVSPLVRSMGMRFAEMSPERMVATLPVAGNEQNMGLLHGGAHMVLAETLGSIAAILHVRLSLGQENAVVGTELNATHHRAATEGLVTAVCTPITRGRTLTSHEIVMRDERDRRLSTARMTNMILPARG